MENDSIQKSVFDLLLKILATRDKCKWIPNSKGDFNLHMKRCIIQSSMKTIEVFEMKVGESHKSILKYEVGVDGDGDGEGDDKEIRTKIAGYLAVLYSKNCEMVKKQKSETVIALIDELNAMS